MSLAAAVHLLWTTLILAASADHDPQRGSAAVSVRDAGDPQPIGLEVTADLAARSTLFVGEEVRFDVTVRSPRGERVSLRMPAVPPGLVLHPLTDALSPATAEVRWHVSRDFAGTRSLVFEAWTDATPSERTLLTVDVHVVGTTGWNRRMETGDVTGDGIPDIVAAASAADVDGVTNCGAVYVWPGGAAPDAAPTATLLIPGKSNNDFLGLELLRLADVTGDGLLDILVGAPKQTVGQVARSGAVQIWAGSSSLALPGTTPAPLATLVEPVLGDGAELSLGTSQCVYTVDLTDDGVLDVVVASESGDVGGVADTGAVCIWEGGASLSGTPPLFAALSVPWASPGDALGFVGGGYSLTRGLTPGYSGSDGFLFGDVTGDGRTDLVVGASGADLDAVNAGVIYVWDGAQLGADPGPTAALGFAAAAAQDRLGVGDLTHNGQGMRLLDFDADGTLDVVALAKLADVSGVVNAGALYFWSGGAGLAGKVEPTARFTVPNAATNDYLGSAAATQVEDVTGDGYADLVVGSWWTEVWGIADQGALYVFAGGPDAATRSGPYATLVGPASTGPARVGEGPPLGRPGPGVLLEDVTGDGIRDVLATARGATIGGATDAGAVFVWHGGATLQGQQLTDAILQRGTPMAGDQLGWEALSVADLNADGILDVITGAHDADFPGAPDVGAVLVWTGGPGLSGALIPWATLWSGDPGTERLPNSKSFDGPCVLLADVTGDARLDVIAASPDAALSVRRQGALYVWDGASLTGSPPPAAVLPGPLNGSELPVTTYGMGVHLVDVTQDGRLDLVVSHSWLPSTGVGGSGVRGGAIVWPGGPSLVGSPPGVLVQGSHPQSFGNFARGAPDSVRTIDLSGDGQLDLLMAGSSFSQILVTLDETGGMLLAHGPLGASPAPLVLFVPNARPDDRLCD